MRLLVNKQQDPSAQFRTHPLQALVCKNKYKHKSAKIIAKRQVKKNVNTALLLDKMISSLDTSESYFLEIVSLSPFLV